MEKRPCSDIAAFPELFSDMEQFIEEMAQGIKHISFRLAVLATIGTMLVTLVLINAA